MSYSKTFRLFLSSTFNDLRAERDKLQAEVFPKLRRYCEKRGFSFQPIDLRWGVSSEAGNDQKTMQICLDEVKRCKHALNPHFAVMLGERYGWIPLPAQVVANEFELVKDAILVKYPGDSKENAYIDLWYKKDENAVPAEYRLQPKLTKEHQDWTYWGDVENTLREAFCSVVNNELKEKLTDDQKFKYIKSATEQEILEGLFHNENIAKKNIYFYDRNFENIDDLNEDEFAALEAKDKAYRKEIEAYNAENPDHKKAAYEITVKHFSDFKNGSENKLDEKIRPNHHELIKKIKSELPEQNVKTYNIKLDPGLGRTQDSVTEDYLQQFADDFYNTIFESMKKEIDAFQDVDSQTRELNEQQSFLNEKAKIFVGRDAFLNKIDSYISSEESNAPLVIYADSGSGKSALMAKVIQNTIESHSNDDTIMAYRFAGTSEFSNNPLNLHRSLYTEFTNNEALKEICDAYIEENELQLDQVLIDLKELSKMTANLLENFPEDKKLIFFVDALDQFLINDPLDWLPRTIPAHVKIVLSTLPDTYDNIQYLPRLKQKYKEEESFLFLDAFNSDEARSMIDAYPAALNRTLTTEQNQKVLDAFIQSGSPLYLKILLEEACEWNSYTDVKDEKYPKELDDLIARLLARLHTHSHHSHPLIKYAFAYIACSKDGLPEPELLDILSQEKEIMDDVSNEFYPRPSRLPTAVWARLYSQMAHYLSIKEVDGLDQISFFHRKFNEGAYKLLENRETAHTNLANFYEAVYNQTLDVDTSEESALTELPYQLIMSKQKENALTLLTDFEFLMKKFKLNRTQEVMEDYALAKAMGMNQEG